MVLGQSSMYVIFSTMSNGDQAHPKLTWKAHGICMDTVLK